MASTTGEAQSPPSENDAGERPVRKQLKETSIDSATGPVESRRKRSFDEARDADANAETGESRRKRSRESSPQDAGNTGTNTVSASIFNNIAPSDSGLEDALEPVDLPNLDWIVQLDAREQALAMRWRELETIARDYEEWEEKLQVAEAKLKQREKWFEECVSKLEKHMEEVSARESDLAAREGAVEARERALGVSELGGIQRRVSMLTISRHRTPQ